MESDKSLRDKIHAKTNNILLCLVISLSFCTLCKLYTLEKQILVYSETYIIQNHSIRIKMRCDCQCPSETKLLIQCILYHSIIYQVYRTFFTRWWWVWTKWTKSERKLFGSGLIFFIRINVYINRFQCNTLFWLVDY